MDDSCDRNLEDVLFLYKLAQSVGQDLDPQSNCQSFVSTLLAQRNFSYCSVWLREDAIRPASPDTMLRFYATPRGRARSERLSCDHAVFSKGAYSVELQQDNAESQQWEADAGREVAAMVPIGNIGWLRLLSSREQPVERRALMQLAHVGRRLATALEGAFAYQGLVREREERNTLEAQLRQAQKMGTIGRMTGGIAHDFNNILTSILGFADLGEMRIYQADRAELLDYFNEIRTAGGRGRDVVAKLLTYSRGGVNERTTLDISASVLETIRLLRPTLRAGVSLRCAIGDALPLVLANEAEIAQICLNLCINAHDASGDKGEIEVAVELVDPGTFACQSCLGDAPARSWVRLRVTDKADGISPAVQGRMFDPFYTTKGPSGTGLGLSMVHGLTHRHGGHIQVRSLAGSGTSVEVYFPTASA